jgi:hypothetical protein
MTAHKSADKTTWLVTVTASDLSWTAEQGGKLFAEVTAMAVAFDDRNGDGQGRYKPEGKNRMLSHVSRELQNERPVGSAVPESVL